jgi:cob(I)alamin adenosyltransferase
LKRGFIQVYTGDGKGKTTAAFGLALRAVGQGLRVRIYQFLKSGTSFSGELRALEKGRVPLSWKRFEDQIPPLFQKIKTMDDSALRRSIRQALDEVAADLLDSEADLVVLDDIIVALSQGWLAWEDLLAFLDERPPGTEVVLTGRGAPQALIDIADLVTEMREVKHPFQAGVGARKGIEF